MIYVTLIKTNAHICTHIQLFVCYHYISRIIRFKHKILIHRDVLFYEKKPLIKLLWTKQQLWIYHFYAHFIRFCLLGGGRSQHNKKTIWQQKLRVFVLAAAAHFHITKNLFVVVYRETLSAAGGLCDWKRVLRDAFPVVLSRAKNHFLQPNRSHDNNNNNKS